MSLLNEAKMPSLKDKIEEQAAEAERIRAKKEKEDEKELLTIKKRSKKK